MAPVIRLQPLTPEELLVLVEKLADIHAGLYGYERRLSEDDLARFLELELGRVGADTHVTPREVIRDFVELLDVMLQSPDATVEDLLGQDGALGAGPQPAEGGTSAAGGSAVVVGATAARRADDDQGFAEFTI